MRAYPDIATAWQRLAEHLGEHFNPTLTDFDTCRAYLDREWARLGVRFYDDSMGYLYDLTHFAFMGAKDRFFQVIAEHARAHGLARLADIGCGVGLDAQALLKSGFDVDLFDLPNPCLRYAAWRLERDLAAGHRVHPISELPHDDYDLVYAVDVLGHVPNPPTLIDTLFATGRHVCINLFLHDPRHRYGPADLHPRLDHERILPLLQQQGTLVRLDTSGDTIITVWRRDV